jgi:hypothetical protein
MRCILVIVTTLALTGCSDVVTTRFATLEDARSQSAFGRGWLPPVLPESARGIVERNDLDVNTGRGSFDYDLSERSVYLERLVRSGAVLRGEQGADILTVITNGSRWELRLPRNEGKARWGSRQL